MKQHCKATCLNKFLCQPKKVQFTSDVKRHNNFGQENDDSGIKRQSRELTLGTFKSTRFFFHSKFCFLTASKGKCGKSTRAKKFHWWMTIIVTVIALISIAIHCHCQFYNVTLYWQSSLGTRQICEPMFHCVWHMNLASLPLRQISLRPGQSYPFVGFEPYLKVLKHTGSSLKQEVH